MKLLVVTPTLGKSPWLDQTVASVARGARETIHVLVGPAETESELGSRYPHTVFVSEPGGGMYAAINAGLAFAASVEWDWFTYLNDDDTWIGEGPKSVLNDRALGRQPDASYGRVALIRENGDPVGELPVSRRPSDIPALLRRGIVPFAQPGMLFRRSLVEKLNGFDISFRSAGDLDFWVRALQMGARFQYVPRVLAAFRLRAGQLSKNESEVRRETDRALAPLRLETGTGSLAALIRFRLSNLTTYIGRLRHFGVARMSDVYRRS